MRYQSFPVACQDLMNTPQMQRVHALFKKFLCSHQMQEAHRRIERIASRFQSLAPSHYQKVHFPKIYVYEKNKSVLDNVKTYASKALLYWSDQLSSQKNITGSVYNFEASTRLQTAFHQKTRWEDRYFEPGVNTVGLVLNQYDEFGNFDTMDAFIDFVMYHELGHHYQVWRQGQGLNPQISKIVNLTTAPNSKIALLAPEQETLFWKTIQQSKLYEKDTWDRWYEIPYIEKFQSKWMESYADVMALCCLLKEGHSLAMIHEMYEVRSQYLQESHMTCHAMAELFTLLSATGVENVKKGMLEDYHELASYIVHKVILDDVKEALLYPDRGSSMALSKLVYSGFERVGEPKPHEVFYQMMQLLPHLEGSRHLAMASYMQELMKTNPSHQEIEQLGLHLLLQWRGIDSMAIVKARPESQPFSPFGIV